MSNSLYSEYLKERGDAQVIELAEGFATYSIPNETQIYLMDIYVKPEHRRSRVASSLADMVATEGKRLGMTEMITTVIPSLNNSTISLKTILKYGFTLQNSVQNLILFKKDII